jgi:hypothetical protein
LHGPTCHNHGATDGCFQWWPGQIAASADGTHEKDDQYYVKVRAPLQLPFLLRPVWNRLLPVSASTAANLTLSSPHTLPSKSCTHSSRHHTFSSSHRTHHTHTHLVDARTLLSSRRICSSSSRSLSNAHGSTSTSLTHAPLRVLFPHSTHAKFFGKPDEVVGTQESRWVERSRDVLRFLMCVLDRDTSHATPTLASVPHATQPQRCLSRHTTQPHSSPKSASLPCTRPLPPLQRRTQYTSLIRFLM